MPPCGWSVHAKGLHSNVIDYLFSTMYIGPVLHTMTQTFLKRRVSVENQSKMTFCYVIYIYHIYETLHFLFSLIKILNVNNIYLNTPKKQIRSRKVKFLLVMLDYILFAHLWVILLWNWNALVNYLGFTIANSWLRTIIAFKTKITYMLRERVKSYKKYKII